MKEKQFVYLKHPVLQEDKAKYRKEGKTILDERFKPKGEDDTPKKPVRGKVEQGAGNE